jgi:hypothetical protein
LAIEPGDKIKQLCNPGALSKYRQKFAYVNDISFFSHLPSNIREDAESFQPHAQPTSAGLAALNRCADTVALLQQPIAKPEPGFSSEKRRFRKRPAFKAAWKADKIRKFPETLRDMKLTLTLAGQASSSYFLQPYILLYLRI